MPRWQPGHRPATRLGAQEHLMPARAEVTVFAPRDLNPSSRRFSGEDGRASTRSRRPRSGIGKMLVDCCADWSEPEGYIHWSLMDRLHAAWRHRESRMRNPCSHDLANVVPQRSTISGQATICKQSNRVRSSNGQNECHNRAPVSGHGFSQIDSVSQRV